MTLPMRETLTLVPHPDDLKYGVRESPEACAIALCVRRTTGAHDVAVGRELISFFDEKENQLKHFKTTKDIQRFIRRFDRGEHCEIELFVVVEEDF